MKAKRTLSITLCALIVMLMLIVPAGLALAVQPVVDAPVQTITMTVGSPMMTVNGVSVPLDEDGTTPIIVNNVTLVPLRAIFEALSLDVVWESGSIRGVQGNTEIRLFVGDRTAYKNGRPLTLQAAPQIINNRTMVPLRFIAESLGADVQWTPATQTINIIREVKYIKLGDTQIFLGDSLARVQYLLGNADRVDPGTHDFDWHVYNSDYSRFIMAGIKNGFVEALYTNSRGFETNNARFGDTQAGGDSGRLDGGVWHREIAWPPLSTTLFYDVRTVYAVWVASDNIAERSVYNDEYARAQERLVFDLTNAFRVNYSLNALLHDEIAEITAREHCRDMEIRNYFSHRSIEGLEPWDRYERNGGRLGLGSSLGENLSRIESGVNSGIISFDGWVDSPSHRAGMLNSYMRYLGVGFYGKYMGQIFVG